MRPTAVVMIGALLAPEVARAQDGAAIVSLQLVLWPGDPLGVGVALEGGAAVGTRPPGVMAEAFLGLGVATNLGWTAALGTRGGIGLGSHCGGGNAIAFGYNPTFELAPEAAIEVSTARPPAFRPGLHVRALGAAAIDVRTRSGKHDWGPTTLGLGTELHLLAGCSYVVVGRPVRGEDGAPVLPAAIGGNATWRERGRGEQASVAAFQRLAAELAQVGAPAGLVARAREAAREEARHALLSYALASRSGPVRVGATPGWSRRPGGRAGLVRLAVESLREGVIDETRGARDAATAAERAGDPVERVVEASIAVEEARHAALAEDVVAWGRREGGRAVVEAVRAVEREV